MKGKGGCEKERGGGREREKKKREQEEKEREGVFFRGRGGKGRIADLLSV